MSNADGKQPDFDEFNLPDEGQLENLEELDLPEASDPTAGLGDLDLPAGIDPLAEMGEVKAVGDETEGVEVAVADEPIESGGEESDAAARKRQKKAAKKKEKPARVPGQGIGMAGLGVFGFCGLSVLLLLVLDAMVFMRSWGFLFTLLMNVFWLMATAIPLIMWIGRKRLNFYEVVLGISLAAIIISVALLLAEIAEYDGEVTPKGGTAAAVQLGAESTIAVA